MHEDEEQAYNTPLVDLKLRCNEVVLNRLYDVFDSDCINSNSDGSYDLTVTIQEDEWVYGYILSLGKSVEVLEPEHIRKIIKTHAIEIAEKY
jgi:predicted DNA-binding transcriptional regulator YafY